MLVQSKEILIKLITSQSLTTFSSSATSKETSEEGNVVLTMKVVVTELVAWLAIQPYPFNEIMCSFVFVDIALLIFIYLLNVDVTRKGCLKLDGQKFFQIINANIHYLGVDRGESSH